MLGLGRKRGTASAVSVDAPAQGAPSRQDATDGFPRGLPDGDPIKPSASARWPSMAEIAAMMPEWKPGMFLLGRDHTGRLYGHADDRHVLTVAGSRAGKGVSLIAPNLLFWPGSVIAIDPKGELASLTASRRSDTGSSWSAPLTPGEGDVYALDPFGRVTGDAKRFAGAAFNPMAGLDPKTDVGRDLAYQIADGLIIQAEGDGAHWTQSARTLLRSLILFVAATEPPASRNLVTVRRLVTQGTEALTATYEEMIALKDEEYDLIARTGSAMKARYRNEASSIVSACESQTAFLEGDAMKRVLSGSTFRLEDLKAKRITIYLCIPATRLATHGRWLRMMVALAMDAMERTGPLLPGRPAVLFCLDEFAALGPMESVEKAAGQIASFGVKLWPIIQDLTQLQRDYKVSWETFMGNAGLLTFFGNTDMTTANYIAQRLGETEVIRVLSNASETWGQSGNASRPDPIQFFLGNAAGQAPTEGFTKGGTIARAQNAQRAPLMHAGEIVQAFARETGKILVMIPNLPPFALYRCVHHREEGEDAALFGGLYDPIEGQKPPHTNRARREERNRSAAGMGGAVDEDAVG